MCPEWSVLGPRRGGGRDDRSGGGGGVVARSILFTFVVVAEMGLVQVIRRRHGHSLRSNPYLLAAITLQVAVLYTPVAPLFGVVGLSPVAWLQVLLAVGVVLGRTRSSSRFSTDSSIDVSRSQLSGSVEPIDEVVGRSLDHELRRVHRHGPAPPGVR